MRLWFLSLAVGFAALFAACRGGVEPSTSAAPAESIATAAASTTTSQSYRGVLTVFAASSLTDAFNEIGAEFKKSNPGANVTFNFAASTALRTQLEQGAKADVYASADQTQMDNALKSGVIDGAVQIFAKNKLVVVYPAANPARIAGVQDLARPGVRFVLTDPNVPIGAYARTALRQMSKDPQFTPDFADRVLANLRSEEANVRAVVTKVQLGEADASIVYASDVTPAVTRDVKALPIPDHFNVVATYPIAVVKDGQNKEAARGFIAFVRSQAAQAILRKHNFIVDEQTSAGRLGISGLVLRGWPPPRLFPRVPSPNFGGGVGGGCHTGALDQQSPISPPPSDQSVVPIQAGPAT